MLEPSVCASIPLHKTAESDSGVDTERLRMLDLWAIGLFAVAKILGKSQSNSDSSFPNVIVISFNWEKFQTDVDSSVGLF